jgi:hypothetical protein
MEMPIHMVLEKQREAKRITRERIKAVIAKYVNNSAVLQQIMQDIDREAEVQENG